MIMAHMERIWGTRSGHTAGADLPEIYGIQFSRDTGIQEAGGSSGRDAEKPGGNG